MDLLKLPVRKTIILVVLTILAAFATYYDGRPQMYVGYLLALLLLFVGGMVSDQIWGTISGGIAVSLGVLTRFFIPQNVPEKFAEASAQYQSFVQSYFWLMILLAAFSGFLGGKIAQMIAVEKAQPMSRVRRLTMIAIFVALSVVINSARIGSVSFGGFPIIFSGYILGPISGFLVGAVADVVGFLVRPSSSAFNVLFTLTSALTGFIPVVVTGLVSRSPASLKTEKLSFPKVLLGILVGQTITSVFLAPLFQMILLQKGFWILVGKAAVKQAVSIPIYAFLCVSIHDALSRTMRLDRVTGKVGIR